MVRLAETLADRMLSRLVPKATAQACSCWTEGNTCLVRRCCRYGSSCGSISCGNYVCNCC
ncbi:hypothetical protein [Sphaerimonospora mesophila]|uniref:hypothetical protein n=1 Tax=Sphaerimonospora mesophila TaxID=37483 RepID=UPI0006E13DD2